MAATFLPQLCPVNPIPEIAIITLQQYIVFNQKKTEFYEKDFKLLCATVLIGCFMAVPAQAAETKAEYKILFWINVNHSSA